MFSRRAFVFLALLLIAAPCQANSNFIAFMNSRVGTWKHTAKQTGPEPMEWTVTSVVTRTGKGSSLRWKQDGRRVFKGGKTQRSIETTGLIKDGGWYVKSDYGEARFYRNGKVRMESKIYTATGRWSMTGRKTLKINYTTSDGYRDSSTLTIISPGRWRSVATSSYGTRTVVNARKVR